MWKKVRQLSHEDIVAIYEVLLGRKPESEDAINGYLGLGSAAALRHPLILEAGKYAFSFITPK
jgi:hypothetical protein